jgi:beta-N-acetylhexosaminidase
MIMSTDLMMPALDPRLPAELSPTIITGILRNEFHYDGVIVTDALWMDGIAKKWNLVQASIMALNAGDDMLLGAIGSAQMEQVLHGLKAALADGQLSLARVNQAVTRIITLKFRYHILHTPWY